MMADDNKKPWTLQPMVVTVTDHGRTLQVSDVQPWIEERKALLKRARDILAGYDGDPVSLYKQYWTLVDITTRLAEIKAIFDSFNDERIRHVDANIVALVTYFQDPKTMEGVDE